MKKRDIGDKFFDGCLAGERRDEAERLHIEAVERMTLAAILLGFVRDQYGFYKKRCKCRMEFFIDPSAVDTGRTVLGGGPGCDRWDLLRKTIAQIEKATTEDEVRKIVVAAVKSVAPKGKVVSRGP